MIPRQIAGGAAKHGVMILGVISLGGKALGKKGEGEMAFLTKKIKAIILATAIAFFISIPIVAHAKTLVFPHLVVSKAWSFGVAVANAGEDADAVTVETWENETIQNVRRVVLAAHGRWISGGGTLPDGIYTVLIKNCSDYTFGTMIRLWNGKPVSEESAGQIPYAPDLQSYNSRDSFQWAYINHAAFYTQNGKCRQMGKYHWLIFRNVLRETYWRYRDKPGIDPRPALGDANASP